jgi:protein involved in polysaccharide export with SLBB domain
MRMNCHSISQRLQSFLTLLLLGLSISTIQAQTLPEGIPQLPIQIPTIIPTQTGTAGSARIQTAPNTTGVDDATRKQMEDPALKAKNDSLRKADELVLKANKEKEEFRKKIYGYTLFKNEKGDFSSSLKIATPRNYVLGADDELIIDVNGYHVANYRKVVTPEGFIRIGGTVGNIQVAGKTVEQATELIRSRLSSIYSGLNSEGTYLSVNVGSIKTIRITVQGEVMRPGIYPVSSFATITTALYQAGGINEFGSFREVRLIRGNKVVTVLDVYDILTNGSSKADLSLKDQDVIQVTPYKVRVSIEGKVKRQGFYEMLPNETLENLITYASGFENDAFSGRLKVVRNTDRQHRFLEVVKDEFGKFNLQDGDKVAVEAILERYENQVKISGAVYRQGSYALDQNPTLLSLVKNAQLKEDAFTARISVVRLLPDLSLENISINLGDILKGSSPDISLKREDEVVIKTKVGIREKWFVRIQGAVNLEETDGHDTGYFPFVEGESIEDLIIRAGGLKAAASTSRVDVFRQKLPTDQDDPANNEFYEKFSFTVNRDLSINKTNNFTLKPFDQVFVRFSPNFDKNKSVYIEGQVLYPGEYILETRNQRISDLVRLAGGLNTQAYPEGATLLRTIKLSKQEIADRAKDIAEQTDNEKAKVNKKDFIKVEEVANEKQETIDINLVKILAKQRIDEDLFLQEGDVLRVPKFLQTVRIQGEVLYPTTTRFKGGTFKDYISAAGGYTSLSRKKRAFVRYANGTVRSTKKVLFFNNYPPIEPGAEIFVPTRTKSDVTFQQAVSNIGSVTGVLVGLANATIIYLALKKQ